MKKFATLIFLNLMLISFLNAQEFKKFRVGLGAGYAGSNLLQTYTNSGFLITLEPAYHVGEQATIGLRAELVKLDHGSNDATISYSLNAQFYLTDNDKFRPFVGVGIGMFNLENDKENQVVFYPRLGFDAGHFNMAIEYNLMQASTQYYYNTGIHVGANENYLGIRIGVFLGGGKKPATLKQ